MCVNQLEVKNNKKKKRFFFFFKFQTKVTCNGSETFEELRTVFSVRLERKPALSGNTFPPFDKHLYLEVRC